MIAKGRSTRTDAEELLYPTNGYRGSLKRKGIAPKNHQTENLRLLRDRRQEFVDRKERAEAGKKSGT